MDAIIFKRQGIYAGHLIPHSWTGSSIIPKKREKFGYTTCLMYMQVHVQNTGNRQTL